ncbi:modifier of mdg4 isoform X2 [Procambarus clarkii]|uniref:modifier of mdg4 isoform X2 n=1 Tax=Procambarus clarkii TaxID=6728 RepID=UPI003742BA21
MQKKRSAVWRHFEEEGDNKVACRTCHKRLTKHGNTSMMIRHLRGQHPELMHCQLDAEGPTVTGEGVSWQIEEQQVDDVVESLPSLDNSVKKKRSTVWRHFQEEGNDKVSCRICNEKLAKHGNTSSMLRHLRGKHPQLKLGDLQGDRKLNRLHLRSSNSETRFLSVCERLLRHNQLTDCTLVADGQFVQAHRLILATCSESFEDIFKTVTNANPVIVLRDITIQELRGLINYIYKGETLVKSSELPGLLKAASQLKIKGLSQMGLADSWLEDSRASGGLHQQHMGATTKADMTFYHEEDPGMDDLDDDEVDEHVGHSAQGERKKSGSALDLMAMCEEVELEETHTGGLGTPEDDTRTMKRVQIKLEHGTSVSDSHVQTSVEISPMTSHLHQHQSHQSATEYLTTEEEVDIHKESIEMREDHRSAATRATIRISHDDDDPLSHAVKVTEASEEMGDQNMSSILTTSGTMMRMGSAQHVPTSVQSTIDVQDDGGLILLGLAGGEPQNRVYAAGSSQSSTPLVTDSMRPTPPRRIRKYSKHDLITALNLVRDGHLGIKPAARAFNIPVATLYNVTKRHNISSPMQQAFIFNCSSCLTTTTTIVHNQVQNA